MMHKQFSLINFVILFVFFWKINSNQLYRFNDSFFFSQNESNLQIPKMFQQFYFVRCHIVAHQETSVESEKFSRYSKKSKLNFRLGKRVYVVGAP